MKGQPDFPFDVDMDLLRVGVVMQIAEFLKQQK